MVGHMDITLVELGRVFYTNQPNTVIVVIMDLYMLVVGVDYLHLILILIQVLLVELLVMDTVNHHLCGQIIALEDYILIIKLFIILIMHTHVVME